MDNKQIKDLMTAMERWKIKKLHFKNKEGEEIELEKDSGLAQAPPPVSAPIPAPSALPQEPDEQPSSTSSGDFITSPMVGTYYSAASPEDPPFVKVGDRVDATTIVCIIEAMKVMNEVKAGMSGVIKEIYNENAHPVEFGTKLFKIE